MLVSKYDIIYLEPEPLTIEEKREIIRRLVKPEMLSDYKLWGKQIRLFNALILRYPDTSFWRSFHPDYQVISVAWYNDGQGMEDLIRSYNKNCIDFKLGNPIIGDAKIGEDIVTKQTQPNLKGWLEK